MLTVWKRTPDNNLFYSGFRYRVRHRNPLFDQPASCYLYFYHKLPFLNFKDVSEVLSTYQNKSHIQVCMDWFQLSAKGFSKRDRALNCQKVQILDCLKLNTRPVYQTTRTNRQYMKKNHAYGVFLYKLALQTVLKHF